MSLKNYLNNLIERGFLKKEEIGVDQVRALLKSASKNLRAAQKNLNIQETKNSLKAAEEFYKKVKEFLEQKNLQLKLF